jgi:hypothetical protein
MYHEVYLFCTAPRIVPNADSSLFEMPGLVPEFALVTE